MIAVSLQFSRADIADFRRHIQRLRFELGLTPEDATRVAAISFLRSMGASTKKGKLRRNVTQEKIRFVTLKNGRSRLAKVNNSFIAERWNKAGQREDVRIFAASLSEAKASPAAKIRYAGLAKASWGWAQQRLFGKTSVPNVRKPQRTFLELAQRGSGIQYEVEIGNVLDYISAAMQGGRGPAVSTALARASNAMRSRIEKKITRATR